MEAALSVIAEAQRFSQWSLAIALVGAAALVALMVVLVGEAGRR